jgi:hypothetical protein
MYHSNSVKKKEEIGGTSPTSAYEEKKMNSSGCKSPSESVPHHTLPSYPSDYHPSNCLSFTWSPTDRRREAGRTDAIAVGGGWNLDGVGELKNEGGRQRSLGARK